MVTPAMIPYTNSTSTASASRSGNSSSNQKDSSHDERQSMNHQQKERADINAASQSEEHQERQHDDEHHVHNHDRDALLVVPTRQQHQDQQQQNIVNSKARKIIENSQTNASTTTSINEAARVETTPSFLMSVPPAAPSNSTAGTQQQELEQDKSNKPPYCPSSLCSNSIKSTSVSANNDEALDSSKPPAHSAPTSSTMEEEVEIFNIEKDDDGENDYKKQSERKRCREKKRRQSISAAIEKLASTLVKVDPSNLIWHNNQVYFGDTAFAGSSKRARYGGASCIKNQPLNRTEIINHTVHVVEKLAVENEETKLKMLQLQYALTRSNDTRMSPTTSMRGVGNLLSSVANFSSQRLNDESMSNLLRPQQHHNNNPHQVLLSANATPNMTTSLNQQQQLCHPSFVVSNNNSAPLSSSTSRIEGGVKMSETLNQHGFLQQHHLLSGASSSRQHDRDQSTATRALFPPYHYSSLSLTGTTPLTAGRIFDSSDHGAGLLHSMGQQQQLNPEENGSYPKNGYSHGDRGRYEGM